MKSIPAVAGIALWLILLAGCSSTAKMTSDSPPEGQTCPRWESFSNCGNKY